MLGRTNWDVSPRKSLTTFLTYYLVRWSVICVESKHQHAQLFPVHHLLMTFLVFMKLLMSFMFPLHRQNLVKLTIVFLQLGWLHRTYLLSNQEGDENCIRQTSRKLNLYFVCSFPSNALYLLLLSSIFCCVCGPKTKFLWLHLNKVHNMKYKYLLKISLRFCIFVVLTFIVVDLWHYISTPTHNYIHLKEIFLANKVVHIRDS